MGAHCIGIVQCIGYMHYKHYIVTERILPLLLLPDAWIPALSIQNLPRFMQSHNGV